jgi:pimeloyl-ACP methyl ester carboxylesterase
VIGFMTMPSKSDLDEIKIPAHLVNAQPIEMKAYLEGIGDPLLRAISEEIYLIGMHHGRQENAPGTLVIMMHGILTDAVWHYQLEKHIKEETDAKVYKINYGLFSCLGLFCPPPIRLIRYRRVLTELREACAMHPNHKFIVIAHSFGTYLICRILLRNTDIRLHHLILCGSIVRAAYPWERLPNYPDKGVINDCGTRDFWPIFARAITLGYGASGKYGFQSGRIKNRFHNLGHSDFFSTEFFRTFWLPAIASDAVVESEWTTKRPAASVFPQLFFPGSGLLILTLLVIYIW